MFNIRPASIRDLYQLTRLCEKAVEHQRGISSYPEEVPHTNWESFMKKRVENPYELILVAEDSVRLVGYINVRIVNHKIESRVKNSKGLLKHISTILRRSRSRLNSQNAWIGFINDCYVDETERRQGIGSKLLREGIKWLRDQGIKRVELSVLTGNREGEDFWRSQGFRTYRIFMKMSIEGD